MAKSNPSTFYIRTYGCQMNELDSEIMVGMLQQRGLKWVTDETEADLLIFNTCSIRDLAERKVMGKLGKLGNTAQAKQALIGVTGCMANAKKGSLLDKLPHVDFVLGTNNIHDLHRVLDELIGGGDRMALTDRKFIHELDYHLTHRDDPVKAHVSISRGCDKFCTYCVVPYTRGPEVSRSPEAIVAECKALVDRGYQEITLLGQNVNSYGKDHPEWGCLFHDLLARIADESGVARLRFMTSHPVDITRQLMYAIRDVKAVCPFVHFPFQAGSNRILRKMHRIYLIEEYLEKVEQLRSIVPGVALGTDVIVGYPTETYEEFLETKKLIRDIEFSVGFFFTYSPRKGTPAMRWTDDVPLEEKEKRLQELLEEQEPIYAKQRQALLGQEIEVLLEGPSMKDPRLLKGRTPCWKKILVPAPERLIGTFQRVRPHSFTHQTLLAELATPAAEEEKEAPRLQAASRKERSSLPMLR